MTRFKALAVMLGIFVLAIVTVQPAQAQTFKVLHSFTGKDDGNVPRVGVVDRAGNIYGVATEGGNQGSGCNGYGCGTVFKLSRLGAGWVFSTIYHFQGGYDGYSPYSITLGPDGSLYGATTQGGIGSCGNGGSLTCGMVYQLRPPATFCRTVSCPWNQTVLYRFTGGSDGGVPTELGGNGGCSGYSCGTIFKLTPSGSGWTESVLYSFLGGSRDGYFPTGTLVFDRSGNLYGATQEGGASYQGTVFQLTPGQYGWTENLLFQFNRGFTGEGPNSVIFDPQGNLYGTTFTGGAAGCGTAFELAPSGGMWNFSVLYSFFGGAGSCGPFVGLIMDVAGNLYGTTNRTGAYGYGVVFKLTPSGQGWTYTSLHDFTGGYDGYSPGGLLLDANGNLFGRSGFGGEGCSIYGCGVVWEITP
jgi:uncharacterized repeat protein (TIGR03803 family)